MSNTSGPANNLHPSFLPAARVMREFRAAVKALGRSERVSLALEQGTGGDVFRFNLDVFPQDHLRAVENFRVVERTIKFMLWSRGGSHIYFHGPEALAGRLAEFYRTAATALFDSQFMGGNVYGRPFTFSSVPWEQLPDAKETRRAIGAHRDGCRIGFDLGASYRKVVALREGKVVYSDSQPWNPSERADPQYHFDRLMEMLQGASEKLPRVDAIGGSSAGVFVNNQVRISSLFRGVTDEAGLRRVRDLFLELRTAWGGIPFDVVNDGEVAALNGAMSMNRSSLLGLALGSSLGGGYVTPGRGTLTSWLNELAFVPVDFDPSAPRDEWSGDSGCGVQYHSQQAAARLMDELGIAIKPGSPISERISFLQKLVHEDDPGAVGIFEMLGEYMANSIAHFSDFYDLRNVLLMGGVTAGRGGELLHARASSVLKAEYPDVFERVEIHLPPEHERKLGMAVAAASLAAIDSRSRFNPYRDFIEGHVRLFQDGAKLPLGGFAAPAQKESGGTGAGAVMVFAPHPDDECVIGGLPLRLRRELGARIVNVAVTQGSRRERQGERWEELRQACEYLSFELVGTRPGGLERVNPQTRASDPAHWNYLVGIIAELIRQHRPGVVVVPHRDDWNITHIGTHYLVFDALRQIGDGFSTLVIESEFWGAMASPNLLVESSPHDVAALVAALSFHVGEVRRNAYHLRLPGWMEDNVRRGAELVGGQGNEAPNCVFATLYRLQKWDGVKLLPFFEGGKHLLAGDNLRPLFF